MKSSILLIASLTLLAGAAAAGADTRPARKDAMSAGGALYVSTGCADCHGHVGQGGSAGPRLMNKPYALPAFTRQLRAPTGDMPPYSERVLKEADVARLHDYVTSLK